MQSHLKLTLVMAAAALSSSLWAQSGLKNQALLERGKYLMNGVVACGNCHFQRDAKGEPLLDKGLSGGFVFDEPPFKAYASNITPDPETGIGKWTDAQLAKAIREGIRPDKSVIGPPMPMAFYRNLSDDDLAAIIAYLRAQKPVRHVVPKSTYNIPLPPNYGPPIQQVRATSPRDKVKYGAYLVEIGHCMECHTPRDEKGMLRLSQLGAGGQHFPGPWGTSVSRNLTPHETGLKNASDAQIERAIREGVDPTGQALKPPMGYPFYKTISNEDMSAIVAYLRTLKPLAFAGKH